MFDLIAVDHEGLSLERIAGIPLHETHAALLNWLDSGTRAPVRIARNADPDVLRKMQQTLAFHGVRTQLEKARSASGSRSAVEQVVAEEPLRPPTADQPAAAGTRTESGLLQYRQMIAEQEARRSSASHVVATSVGGFRWQHAVVLVALAVTGLLIAFATRAGAETIDPPIDEVSSLGAPR